MARQNRHGVERIPMLEHGVEIPWLLVALPAFGVVDKRVRRAGVPPRARGALKVLLTQDGGPVPPPVGEARQRSRMGGTCRYLVYRWAGDSTAVGTKILRYVYIILVRFFYEDNSTTIYAWSLTRVLINRD